MDSIFIIVDSLVPTKIFKVDTILSKAYEHHVIYNISQKKKNKNKKRTLKTTTSFGALVAGMAWWQGWNQCFKIGSQSNGDDEK